VDLICEQDKSHVPINKETNKNKNKSYYMLADSSALRIVYITERIDRQLGM